MFIAILLTILSIGGPVGQEFIHMNPRLVNAIDVFRPISIEQQRSPVYSYPYQKSSLVVFSAKYRSIVYAPEHPGSYQLDARITRYRESAFNFFFRNRNRNILSLGLFRKNGNAERRVDSSTCVTSCSEERDILGVRGRERVDGNEPSGRYSSVFHVESQRHIDCIVFGTVMEWRDDERNIYCNPRPVSSGKYSFIEFVGFQSSLS